MQPASALRIGQNHWKPPTSWRGQVVLLAAADLVTDLQRGEFSSGGGALAFGEASDTHTHTDPATEASGAMLVARMGSADLVGLLLASSFSCGEFR
jgi:hypothetical protein